MILNGSIVVHMKRLLSEISELEELPHSFDDTLVDKLLEAIQFTDAALFEFLMSLLSSELQNASSVQLAFVLQLTEKACASGHAQSLGQELITFLNEIDTILYQGRPAKVVSEALRLCQSCLNLRSTWSNVLQWSLTELPRETLSIFVRTQIENLFISLHSEEVHGILDVIAKIFLETNSVIIANGTARILLEYATILSADTIKLLVSHIETGRGGGQTIYDLAGALLYSSQRSSFHEEILFLSKWASEEVRKETAMSIIRRVSVKNDTNTVDKELSAVVDSVLLSPCIKLHNFVDLIHILSDETFKECVRKMSSSLIDRRKSPLTDLIRFFSAVTSRLPLSESASMLKASGCRLLESPALLKSVKDAYGGSCFEEECLAELKNELSVRLGEAISSDSWDDRDSALETATTFPCFLPTLGDISHLTFKDPSPYVRASALRCLIRQEIPELGQICEQVLNEDVDHEPRLEAIKFIESQLPASMSSAFRVLPRAVEDPDFDVRLTMLRICPSLLNHENFALETKNILEDWLHDPEIGFQVRKLLGETSSPPPKAALHVLGDMFSALSISVDDTIDCY